ncbi:hydrogenase maturation protease [Desulfogranum mediterraneum]|uniref:hydrogenase maturation protease n=1 Tax=Desulfogranum mediterraneum TaxID=160661 RepID=UPI000402E14F|nr:hydrogenase maturation protease [Desulfogranum mediterraneum]
MKRQIICIGNRLVPEDAAGPAVFDRLGELQPLADGIELSEGGLAGLNLLPLLEQGGRVVFVDAVRGFTRPGELVVLDQRQIVASLDDRHFGHGAGLAYVLAVLPEVCDGEPPEEIVLVGLEGACSGPLIERAAGLSLVLAAHGLQGCS